MVPSTFYAATASDLIADIKAANLQGGTNAIVLTAPTTSPYVMTTWNNGTDGVNALPVIAANDNLTIIGNGDTIDAHQYGRLFDVAGGASLTLENMTLTHGSAGYVAATHTIAGGAIYNQGTLVLSKVVVAANTATTNGNPNAAGGGIWSNGSLTVENSCQFNYNSATFPLIYSSQGNEFGGAICIAGGTANIMDSAFVRNTASAGGSGGLFDGKAYGGAVYVGGGTVSMSGDTVGSSALDGNSVYAGQRNTFGYYNGYSYGGGLYLAGGTVLLTNDRIMGNYSAFAVGGIYISGAKVSLDYFTWNHTQGNWPSNIYGYSQRAWYGIGSFTASANTIAAGSSLTLTANNITASTFFGTPSATITQVSFYYFDSSGAQHVLGTGTQSSTGVWTLTFKANLAPGAYTLYAQAEDSLGLFSTAALTLTVQ